MQLTLRKKWAIDSQVLNQGAIATRLYPAVYGAIIGDSRSAKPQGKWSGISANLFAVMEGLVHGKSIDSFVKKYDTIDLITYISPLVFTFAEKFDFPLIQRTVEQYAKITGDDARERLGCVIYLEILFRLYHYDDFDSACKNADELFREYLSGTEYARFLPEYGRILKGTIKQLPQTEIAGGVDTVHILEAALWCCQHSAAVLDAISMAASCGGNTAAIATLAGTMAGMYFKEDISPELPETSYNYDRTLAQFLEYCAKIDG